MTPIILNLSTVWTQMDRFTLRPFWHREVSSVPNYIRRWKWSRRGTEWGWGAYGSRHSLPFQFLYILFARPRLYIMKNIYIYIYIYIKLKGSRYRPGVAQRVGRGITLLFHDRGTRRGWVVSSTPQPHFTPGKDPVPILQETRWALGTFWTGGKSRPHRDSIPDRPARS